MPSSNQSCGVPEVPVYNPTVPAETPCAPCATNSNFFDPDTLVENPAINLDIVSDKGLAFDGQDRTDKTLTAKIYDDNEISGYQDPAEWYFRWYIDDISVQGPSLGGGGGNGEILLLDFPTARHSIDVKVLIARSAASLGASPVPYRTRVVRIADITDTQILLMVTDFVSLPTAPPAATYKGQTATTTAGGATWRKWDDTYWLTHNPLFASFGHEDEAAAVDVDDLPLWIWGLPFPIGKGDQGDQGIQGIQGIQGDQGDPGSNGTNGTNGSNGADGADGNTILNGASDPGGGDGVDGDFYINTTTNFLFGPKTSGAWPSGIALGTPGVGRPTGSAYAQASVDDGNFTNAAGRSYDPINFVAAQLGYLPKINFSFQITGDGGGVDKVAIAIYRATDSGMTTNLVALFSQSYQTDSGSYTQVHIDYIDDTAVAGTSYYYQAVAFNLSGGNAYYSLGYSIVITNIPV